MLPLWIDYNVICLACAYNQQCRVSVNKKPPGDKSMDFALTEEHRMVQKMVREFAQKEVAPVINTRFCG